ncbi:MAG: hypothetical protein CMF74_15245 [Maricaulis sp.]|jgi:hypothetical protein|nr:hypothetical protein [Maricaulis sp.]
MNRRMLILLGVAVSLGAIYAVIQLGGGNDTARPVPPPSAEGGVVRTPPIAYEEGPFLPPLSSFPAIANRPLFRPDRRPPAQPVVDVPVNQPVTQPATDRPPDFVVVSVVTGPNGRGAASVRVNGETRRVYAGDMVGNWRIDAIRHDGVQVSSGRERWALPVGEPED